MFSHSILLIGTVLELILVIRGVERELLRRYPVFYSYVAFVLISDLLVFAFRPSPHPYLYFYWITEFAGLLLGCFVFFEFYRVALKPYPGTARMARAVLAVLFAIAIAKTIFTLVNVSEWWFYAKPAQVEGVLRVCQLLAILALTL